MTLKCIIFYYSQSGGTKFIAEIISKEFINKKHECKLIRLEKIHQDIELLENYDFSNIDLIGFGIPVYYFNPPNHISMILRKFPHLENKKGFIFCTSGGNPGSTLHQIEILLNQKGLKVIDGNDRFVCLDRHQFYRDYGFIFPPSQGHPNDEDIQKARNFSHDVLVKASTSIVIEKKDFWKKKSFFAQLCSFKGLNQWFPKFGIDKTKCNYCGVCIKICPTDNISLEPYPKWRGDCNRCYICEMVCPENAIACDWDWMIEMMNKLMVKRGFIPKSHKKYTKRARFLIFLKQIRSYFIMFKIWLQQKFSSNSQ